MIEHETVLEALKGYANSRRKNPQNEHGGCVYTESKYRHRHCVAGQVAHDLGVKLPKPSSASNSRYVKKVREFNEAFTPRALDLLGAVQCYADRMQPWGVAIHKGVAMDMDCSPNGLPEWVQS